MNNYIVCGKDLCRYCEDCLVCMADRKCYYSKDGKHGAPNPKEENCILRHRDARNWLLSCCGNKPEVNDFGDHRFVKCQRMLDGRHCGRMLIANIDNEVASFRVWNLMVDSDIPFMEIKD